MSKFAQATRRLAISLAVLSAAIASSNPSQASVACPKPLSAGIPDRISNALTGSEVMSQLQKVGGPNRDAVVVGQVLSGNVPDFMRELAPVNFRGTAANGTTVEVTLCVTPEYLSVGHDRDFVRVPLGLAAAARIANETGFLLPTPKIVDEIYRQASIRLAPRPMKPTSQMVSTAYFVEHDRTVDAQRAQAGRRLTDLAAGQKKDVVLTNRLLRKPGRVAIYGWHQPNGKPIQPLSTVHGAAYADYSHGVRLVSRTAFVNGKPRDLAEIIEDRNLASLVSSEGPILNSESLLAAQY